jgi:hypothetical protein
MVRVNRQPRSRALRCSLAIAAAVLLLLCGEPAIAQAAAQGAPKASGACVVGDSTNLPARLQSSGSSSLAGYLVDIPNPLNCNVISLENGTSGLALGIMGSVATISLFLTFLAGRGVSDLVDGLGKATMAVALVVAYKWLYPDLVSIANEASGAVLSLGPGGSTTAWTEQIGLGGLQSAAGAVTIVGLLSDPVAWLANILIVLVMFAVLVAVLVLKIVLSAGTIFLYPAGPIAIALWPIESARWVSQKAGKAIVACMLVPVIWALLAVTFGAVDFVTVGQAAVTGTLGQLSLTGLTNKLVGLALVIALWAIPSKILQEGLGSGGSGGFIRQTMMFAGSSMASNAVGRVAARAFPQTHWVRRLDSHGRTIGYDGTEQVSNKQRLRSVGAEDAAANARSQAADTWRMPDEGGRGFQRRLQERTPNSRRIDSGSALAGRLSGLTPGERNGLRDAYRSFVTATDDSGQPRGNYTAFRNAVTNEAAGGGLAPEVLGAYQDVAAATPRALYDCFDGTPGGQPPADRSSAPAAAAPAQAAAAGPPALPRASGAAPSSRGGARPAPRGGGWWTPPEVGLSQLSQQQRVAMYRGIGQSVRTHGMTPAAYGEIRATAVGLAQDADNADDRRLLYAISGASDQSLARALTSDLPDLNVDAR